MTDQALAHDIPFESRRVPLERRITLKFQHRDGFINEYAANISLKGMFISAWVPEPPASVFLFEVQLADRQRLIHGVGEVVWVREQDEGPDRPAGMGVRFLKLDDDSRAVISGMVAAHVGRGGTPFDPALRPVGTVGVEELFADRPQPAGEPEAAAESQPSDPRPVATVLLDERLNPLAGRAMARRPARHGLLALWATLAVLLASSAMLILLT